jgi:hypothetical protein
MANDPVRSIDPKLNISLHPLSYRSLSFEAEMLSILRACISPACLWWPKSLEAKSAWLEHTPFTLQAAELTAIRRRASQAEATCAA